jgi:hypothetical protein
VCALLLRHVCQGRGTIIDDDNFDLFRHSFSVGRESCRLLCRKAQYEQTPSMDVPPLYSKTTSGATMAILQLNVSRPSRDTWIISEHAMDPA